MFAHYLRTTLRRIFNARVYSAISIVGLAIGMTASILIFSFVKHESSFDAMHHDSERIYRMNWAITESGARFATFYNVLTPVLAEGMEEIETWSRLATSRHLLSADGNDQSAMLSMVDKDFFKLFNYPPVSGDPDLAIQDMNSAVLTEAAAQRLFGTTDAIGKILTVDGAFDFQVSAVVENNPANSHLGSNIFVNIENLPAIWDEPEIWSNFNSDVMYHYVRLRPGTDPDAAMKLARDFLVQNVDFPESGLEILMQPLRDIHFTTDLQNEMSMVDDTLGTVKNLRQRSDIGVFVAVAILTLLISSLNFMNMQTVQFSKRAHEVGVRCIAGSSRIALIRQLLGETTLMALCALLLSLPLSEMLMPWFDTMVGMPRDAASLLTLANLPILVLAAVALGVLAGLYPAITAARIAPAAALRGEIVKGRSASVFRAALVVLQFTMSIGLIIGSFIVNNQIDYAFAKPLGFEPENVVTVNLPNAEAREAYETMRTELLSVANVVSVSAGTAIPTRSLSDGTGVIPAGGDANRPLNARGVSIGEDYFDTLGMRFVAGRAPSEDFAGDRKPPLSAENPQASGSIVLNETAARQAGWSNPLDAVGQRFYQPVNVNGAAWRNDYTVVGVVADAHYGSIRREVKPIIYAFNQTYNPNVMMIKLAERDQQALAALNRIWQEQVPGYPIEWSFLQNSYSALYTGEANTFALFIALTTLAILVACSGLYGLASYNTERRTKEIGVRKVLGSSVWSIVVLLTNDFSKLVLLANVIAWPAAYVGMQRWLENFAYRIDITPVIFIGSGLIALCVAWVTVGSTAAKAASAKPVLALRYE